MNARLTFLVWLIVGVVIVALIFGWLLPMLGVSVALVGRSLVMTLMMWGLWELRKIANK